MQEILLKMNMQGKMQLKKVRKEKAKGMQFTFPVLCLGHSFVDH